MYKLKINTKTESKIFTLKEIAEKLGVDPDILSVSLFIDTDRGLMEAHAYDDGEYGGVDVDGYKDDKHYYMTNAELPTPSDNMPAFVGRLYAGNADQETNGPVAVMPYTDRKEGDKSKRILFYADDCVKPEPDGKLNYKNSTESSLPLKETVKNYFDIRAFGQVYALSKHKQDA